MRIVALTCNDVIGNMSEQARIGTTTPPQSTHWNKRVFWTQPRLARDFVVYCIQQRHASLQPKGLGRARCKWNSLAASGQQRSARCEGSIRVARRDAEELGLTLQSGRLQCNSTVMLCTSYSTGTQHVP
ncbi:hypothetical protein COCMIDRAFT_24941 [Bipolaris oryzae ATCC 44560]|uniref:Uncharacterized protein n=1 Tax=Bipolaris oryzae ATCC 44560 TaxID=930090 RepID=W6ZB55_COCMI|nr:uncharacterized protein COCMIDRAFT_24941 [Bipolaris oryzae ATCC 44560]EUC47175.1 hypothetical protein COCMIDRAFT_24941 [Bipolaris oryzae ATCC 44560]